MTAKELIKKLAIAEARLIFNDEEAEEHVRIHRHACYRRIQVIFKELLDTDISNAELFTLITDLLNLEI